MRVDPNEYVIDKDIVDRDEASRVCAAVLEVLGPRIRTVTIDGYSDYDDVMPPHVRASRDMLHQIGQRQHGRDPGMGVQLRMDDPDQRRLLEVYGPWSINVELEDEQSNMIASFHDCALVVWFKASDVEFMQLHGLLGETGLPIVNVREWRVQAQEEKRAARARRIDQVRRMFGLRSRS